MHWSDSKEVIKAKDIHLTRPAKKARVRLVPDRYRIPTNETDCNAVQNAGNGLDEIEKIKRDAETKIQIAEKNAYHKGFSKGVREGSEREKKELSLAAKAVAELTRKLKALNVDFMKDNKKAFLDLAFAIASRVIHNEVSTNRELVCSVLEDAIHDMQDRQGARILLNPEDYRCIAEAPPAFVDRCQDLLFERDEKIAPGGAVIEMPTGVIDARLEQQFNKIKEALYDGH
jgi:flagellar assembly protein FliH